MATQNIDYVALWGAGLSTLLGVVQLVQFWRERFRLDVGGNFTSASDIGNTVLIRNLAARPVIVSYWRVAWRSRFWPFWKYETIEEPEWDDGDMHLEPFKTCTIQFVEQHWFSTNYSAFKGRKIVMQLFVVGHRRANNYVIHAGK